MKVNIIMEKGAEELRNNNILRYNFLEDSKNHYETVIFTSSN